jgi:LysM repeat protein
MSIHKNKRPLIGLTLAILVLFLLEMNIPALAAPAFQLTPFPTPTPGPDGRIIYVVQPNDTLLRISLISGVPVEELRALNNFTGDNIRVGQELLLGLGGPSQATPTAGPSPTPTAVLPTPSPEPGFGELCVLLFEDLDGDSIRQETEASISSAEISVSDRSGTISKTSEEAVSDEDETGSLCFGELPEGSYSVTVAIPEGYNATTITNYSLSLKAGDKTYVDFGAQQNSEALAQAPVPAGSGPSPVLGIVGGLLLLSGAGLAFFAQRLLKSK